MDRGALVPRRCCKMYCALAVTVKRSVDQLFMYYFHDFLGLLLHLVVLACVLRATTKKVRHLFLGKKCRPQRKSWLRLWICPSLEKILRAPMTLISVIDASSSASSAHQFKIAVTHTKRQQLNTVDGSMSSEHKHNIGLLWNLKKSRFYRLYKLLQVRALRGRVRDNICRMTGFDPYRTLHSHNFKSVKSHLSTYPAWVNALSICG